MQVGGWNQYGQLHMEGHALDKLSFVGKIIGIQPRIRLTRSFDESYHTYLGYSLRIEGEIDSVQRVFSVGIGKAIQAKLQLVANVSVSGKCLPVEDPDAESVEYYKVSQLAIVSRGEQGSLANPWEGIPPELETYRARGHRRLAARTYETHCTSCIWGARMPVEIIVDNWNPRGRNKYRLETFCYGPLNCTVYKAGANRQVEGRNRMVYIEEDWVDIQNTEHRTLDE
jgi:hypothetical protein